jgi:hypothetical protein
LITKILRFKYLNVLKKYSTNKILCFGIIFIFMISSLSAAYPQTQIKAPDIDNNQPPVASNTVEPPITMPLNNRAWLNVNLSYISSSPSSSYNNSRGATYLSIVPSSQTVGYGETFSIIVHLNPGEPIIGVQIDLSFNASLVHVVSVAKADPIWFFFPPIINNTAGEIHGAAVVIFGYNVSTPINCFQITFTSQSIDGTSPLILHNVIVTNQSAQPISPVINNGEVIIEGPENLPPVFGVPSPANGSMNQPLSLTWSIPINDPNGNLFSWSIQCSNGQSGSGSDASNGTKSLSLSGLAYSTTFKVWVNATDPGGSGLYTRRWYSFTTISQNLPPVFGVPSPANGSMNQPLSLTWSIPINDPNGNLFSWSIQCSNGQRGSGSDASNGTKSLSLSGLAYSTTFKVWVNATDPGGSGLYTRRWYLFTTKTNSPPYAPSNPSPTNGSTQILLNTDLSWTGGDPDNDYVTYDVYFGSSFPLIKIKSNISSNSCYVTNLNYSKKYYWKICAWDNQGNTNTGALWSFTTKTDTTQPSLDITQPKKGYFYYYILGGLIQGKRLILFTTFVIGPIEVIVSTSDSQSGINRVEFYIDNEIRYTDNTAPYTWLWNERVQLFPYVLTVRVYDNSNNPSNLSRRVWKIF